MTIQTRIGIVDPHQVVRDGLGLLLSKYEEFDVVGTGSDVESARHLCSVHNPHLLIIDYLTDGATCLKPFQLLQEEFPQTKLFILTARQDKKIINESVKMGVLGYWFKDVSVGELVKAIHSVKNNQPSLAPEALRSILHTMNAPRKVGYNLTKREREVLSWLVEGLSNREIANVLFISYSTVKNHVSKIFSKLNASNRVEAVTIALDKKLIERVPARVQAQA